MIVSPVNSAKIDASQPSTWKMVLEQNNKGVPLKGSKAALINAIRSGNEVRIYWKGKYVEHLTDSNFLTIIEGEVFAQITTIKGQKPTQKPPSVELRDTEWTGIISTQGPYTAKWFVR